MDWKEIFQALLDGITITITLQRHHQTNQKPSNPQEQPRYYSNCEYCEWNGSYYSADSAARALRSHLQHCPTYAQETGWIADMNRGKEPD